MTIIPKKSTYYYPRSLNFSQKTEVNYLLNNRDSFKLSDWEIKFLKSVYERDRQLSSKQINCLNRIFRWKYGYPLIIDDFP